MPSRKFSSVSHVKSFGADVFTVSLTRDQLHFLANVLYQHTSPIDSPHLFSQELMLTEAIFDACDAFTDLDFRKG